MADNFPRTDLRKLQSRLNRLNSERSSHYATWRDLAEIFLPRRGAHLSGGGRDTDRGRRRDNRVLNNTTILAARTLAQGMHAGMTNPSTEWFKNKVEGKMRGQKVKVFTDELTQLERSIFRASNVYRILPGMYREMGIFGPSAVIMRKNHRVDGKYSPKLRDLINLLPVPIGTWTAAADPYGTVNTFYREYFATVTQLVEQFGLGNVSQSVARLWDQRRGLDDYVRCVHVIEPRGIGTQNSFVAANMPYRSTYFEYGAQEDKVLADEGFKRFPVLIPRWDVDSDEVYGVSPGWEALGDGRGLQHDELRRAQVIDYQTLPPLQMPTSLKNGGYDILPGGVSFYDATGPQSGIRPAFEVPLKISDLRTDMNEIARRINETFYVDLFRAILDDRRSNTTAREIAEKHQEKLLLLGPVVERTENEILVPLIDMTFDAILDGDRERAALGMEPLLPEVPGELDDEEEINFEFDGMLSQALKGAQATGLDRFTGTVTSLYTVSPESADKVDLDEVIDQYAELLGVPPQIIRDDKAVVKLREARAAAQQAAQSAELAKVGSEAERNMAQAGASQVASGAPTDIAPAISTANQIGSL